MDSETATQNPTSEPYARRWVALVGISTLSFVVFIDFTIVNTILPGIQRDLNATVDQLQWMMNSFILMLTVFMVTMGRLGDIHGRRKVLYAGVIVFALASFLAGFSWNPQFLIFCRFLQGAAGAVTLTCGAALAIHHFPEEEKGRALAIFMSITGVGMAIGPLIGGVFLSFLSWRWAFFVNVPVITIGFLVSARTVLETPPQTEEKIDWLGLAFMIPGTAALVVFIMNGNNWGWLTMPTMSVAVLAVVCLTVFARVERRVASPIIDFNLLRSRRFLACSVMAITLGGFIVLGNFLAPLYLQTVRNEIPYIAGLMLLPISGLVVLVPPLIGGLTDRWGPMPFIVAGQVFLALSAAVQLVFEPQSPALLVLFGLALFGFGWGLQQATSSLAATSALPPESAGLALGMLWTIWNFGSSVGLAIGGMLFENLDKSSFDAAIAAEKLTLSEADQTLVRSVLSDPSQAQKLLEKLTPGLEQKLLPIFRDSFMAGYSGAMAYLLVTCSIGAVLVYLINRGGPEEKQA